jgi:hypothetical protein
MIRESGAPLLSTIRKPVPQLELATRRSFVSSNPGTCVPSFKQRAVICRLRWRQTTASPSPGRGSCSRFSGSGEIFGGVKVREGCGYAQSRRPVPKRNHFGTTNTSLPPVGGKAGAIHLPILEPPSVDHSQRVWMVQICCFCQYRLVRDHDSVVC